MTIIIPIIAVTAIGLVCAIMLVVASKFMAVPEDETFLHVRECLPGANCGACGYAGCDGYAHALADGEVDSASLCVPGGSTVCSQIAKIMGFEEEAVIPKVAYVACCGERTYMTMKHDYRGIQTCAAASSLYSGYAKCYHSCLGIGDCAMACPQNAICVENGMASVKPHLCVGCGICAKTCPNQQIHIVPRSVQVIVRCSNQDKGVNTRKACGYGCIGCKKCEKVCPADAIKVVSNCAIIDYEKCIGCGKCVDVCTTGCIVKVDFKIVPELTE